jgi:glycosyltransferase involved in cell wall biosynthesis
MKPSYLFVLSSSNQLYSGTGTAIFDWIRHAKKEWQFSILIDCVDERNFRIAKEFCAKNTVPLLVSPGRSRPGAPDVAPTAVGEILALQNWSVVEIVSWANAATNLAVTASISPETKLIFTPHTQPLSTLSREKRWFLVEPVFRQVLQRADRVLCDSKQEHDDLSRLFPEAHGLRVAPLGGNELIFSYCATPRHRRVISVSDFLEGRKRVDLLSAAFNRLLRADNNVDAVLIGRNSLTVPLSPEFNDRVYRLGYVSLETLVHSYRAAQVFVLLSDYEAFGLPILEALLCGLPVVVNRTAELASIFGSLPGVNLVSNKDPDEVHETINRLLDTPPDSEEIAQVARETYGSDIAYQVKRESIVSAPNRGTKSNGILEDGSAVPTRE